MIKILVQEKDKNAEVLSNIDDTAAYIQQKDAILWVDIEKPTHKDMEFLEKQFAFHPLAIEDCMTAIQRPKIDRYDRYLFIVLHAAILTSQKEKAASLELDSFIGENYVVTVHLKPIPSVTTTWERCVKNTAIMSRGSTYLFYFLADALVDNYFPILEKLDKDVQKTEDIVFTNPDSAVLSKIFDLTENVAVLRRLIGPQRETMNFISRGDYAPNISPELSMYFRDVSDLLARIYDILETYRDTLTSILQGYVSMTSNKLNEIMKVLTVIATLMMPLTVIASIYGMNFKHMPELNWRYGYLSVLLVMALMGIGMLIFFRKRKWI